MRLRFRGTCWDEGETPTPSRHPLVPDIASCFGDKSFPPTSMSQIFRKEGELAKATSPPGAPRPRQRAELPSWPCTLAFKRSGGVRENRKLEDKNEQAMKIGERQGQQTERASKPDGISSHEADHAPSISTSPSCCVVASDPTNALVPEPSFSTIFLTDQHRRQHLFSLTQGMLIAGLQGAISTTASPRPTPTDDAVVTAGFDPPLFELMKFVHEAVASLGDSKQAAAVAAAAQEGTPDMRREEGLQSITLDLDEEMSFQLEWLLPSNCTTCVRDIWRSDNDQSVESDDISVVNITTDIPPRPSKRWPSVWGSLDIAHLLTLQAMPPRSYRTTGITVSPDQSTRIESRISIVPRPSEDVASATMAVKHSRLSFDLFEAFQRFPAISERASGDFSRIDIDKFATDNDFELHASKVYVGLLDVLGSMKGEVQMGGTRSKQDCIANVYRSRDYDPMSSSIREDGNPLLQNRYPRAIPVQDAGLSRRGLRQQGRPSTHREHQHESRSCLGDQARRDQRGGGDIPSLALLWMALGKATAASEGPPLWNLTSRVSAVAPGLSAMPARHSIRARNTYRNGNACSTRKEGCPKNYTAIDVSDARLADILAIWRKKHCRPTIVSHSQNSHVQANPRRPLPRHSPETRSASSTSSTSRSPCQSGPESQAQPTDRPLPVQGGSSPCNPFPGSTERGGALPVKNIGRGTSPSATVPLSSATCRQQPMVAQEKQVGRKAIRQHDMHAPQLDDGEVGCDDQGRAMSKEGREGSTCEPESDAFKPILQKVNHVDKADHALAHDGVAKLCVQTSFIGPSDSTLRTAKTFNGASSPRGYQLKRPSPAAGVQGSSGNPCSSEANVPTHASLFAPPNHAHAGSSLQPPPPMTSVATAQKTEVEIHQSSDNGAAGGKVRKTSPIIAATCAGELLAPAYSSTTLVYSAPSARERTVGRPAVVDGERHAEAAARTRKHERDTHDSPNHAREQMRCLAKHRAAPTESGAEDDTAMAAGSGKKRPSAVPAARLKFPKRKSDPVRNSPVVSSDYTAKDSVTQACTSDVAGRRGTARKHADLPICVVVSEDFVSSASEVVLALSSRPKEAQAAAGHQLNFLGRSTQSVSTVSGARDAYRFECLELSVERPVDLVIGSRSAVVILASRGLSNRDGDTAGVPRPSPSREEGVSHSESTTMEATVTKAREKLRLLTLQSLKYSTLWLIVRMDGDRVGIGAERGHDGPTPAWKKMEQWLVGFPCRIHIRYSRSEAQLVELITHAALHEQRGDHNAMGWAASASHDGTKRCRLEPPAHDTAASQGRSPLEAISENSRNDPEWATFHHLQAWFLQLFPVLNAFSASALLSAASLKHLIVSPYEELAPTLLGRGGVAGSAVRRGASAESLAGFCAAVRLQRGGTGVGNPHEIVAE